MEPVFMILGQSAGTIAAMAVDRHRDMQEIKYQELKTMLIKYSQILEYNDSK
jgi:hypothetical protein